MKSIDKNDVNISRLFNWGREFSIVDNFENEIMKVYIRLVGDADLNRSRVFGLRKSAELRKQLNDRNNDIRLAYIPDFMVLDDANIIESILDIEVKTIATSVVRNLKLTLPPEPDSDATLEEQEKYQELVDSWPKNRETKITEEVTKQLNDERKRLAKLSRSDLESTLEKIIINNICETEMFRRFNEMCTFLGSFSDEKFKNPLFETFDQFDSLPTEIKNQFIANYVSLDINLDELKK